MKDAPRLVPALKRIVVVGDEIVYSCGGEAQWRVPLSAVEVIGEFTNESGPWGDDYFLSLVADEGSTWFEASFYAEGANESLVLLGAGLGENLQWSLCNSTGFRSLVMWPPQLAGRPMFEFRQEGFLGKLGLSKTRHLHPRVTEYMAANKRLAPTQ